MSIYGKSLLEFQWKQVTEFKRKEFEKYKSKLKKVIESEYNNKKENKFDEVFLNTITYKEDKQCSFFQFDNSKNTIDQYQYTRMIENIIYRANLELPVNYRFDIIGTWRNGVVILMKK